MDEDESGQIQLVVKKKLSSKRIDKYLVSRLQDFSRSHVQRLIKEEAVKVNDVAVKSSYEIKLNDVISIDLPTESSDHITPEDIPLDVIYEDEYLMVLNKSPYCSTSCTRPCKWNISKCPGISLQQSLFVQWSSETWNSAQAG